MDVSRKGLTAHFRGQRSGIRNRNFGKELNSRNGDNDNEKQPQNSDRDLFGRGLDGGIRIVGRSFDDHRIDSRLRGARTEKITEPTKFDIGPIQ